MKAEEHRLSRESETAKSTSLPQRSFSDSSASSGQASMSLGEPTPARQLVEFPFAVRLVYELLGDLLRKEEPGGPVSSTFLVGLVLVILVMVMPIRYHKRRKGSEGHEPLEILNLN